MTISEKLKDPDLSPEEEAEIIGAFVRRQKREALGQRWANKLAADHGVQRDQLRKAGEKTPRTRRRLLWVLPAVAAAILLLVLLLPQLQAPGQTQTELVAMYVAEAEIPTYRGENEGEVEALQATFARQYNAGDFAAAIQTGEALLGNPAAEAGDRLGLGLAYLNADQLDLAETTFRALLAATSEYRTEATFYLALTLLEKGATGEAKKLLEGIGPDDGAAWERKARAILSAD